MNTQQKYTEIAPAEINKKWNLTDKKKMKDLQKQ